MSERLIEWSLKNRGIVLVLAVALGAAGWWGATTMKLDAIPDLSDVQVIIQTDFMGQAPQVVEDQVTYPITTAMLQVPYAKTVRGYSSFGTSYVYIIFEDGTDLYWARGRVLEQLSTLSGRLPKGVAPRLGPDATGVGWVYQYTLVDKTGQHDLAELRSLQDWFLRYELLAVEGVSDVASIGGFVKQYQVEVDPDKLAAHNIPLARVRQAIARSNAESGARLVELAETEFMVRAKGYLEGKEDLRNVPVGLGPQGAPILLRDVANVVVGPDLRRGVLEWNGEGEAVGGVAIMRYGADAMATIGRVKARLETLKKSLPEGVEIVPAYDRSALIQRAVDNLKEKLLEEILVVALVCIVFLLHLRSAFVSVLTLPLGVLLALLIMKGMGISANIMSLGGIAIAIGVMVDAAVVMVENVHKHKERYPEREHWETVLAASREVGPALFTSLLLITVSFLPVFALGAESGRLFKPLAYTKTFAMAGSALLAVTLIPVVMGYLLTGKTRPESQNPLSRFFMALYKPVLTLALRWRWATLLMAAVIVAATWFPLRQLGSEFMPPLNEGDILYMPTTDPGISAAKAAQLLQQTDAIIKSFPEVKTVFGKAGRAETATDPAPLSMFETTIALKPESEWRPGMTMEKLIAELDRAVDFPGLSNAWTLPIRTRIDMLATGIRTPVGIKLMGQDLQQLSEKAQEAASLLQKLPTTASAFPEKTVGGHYLNVTINRQQAARYGLTVQDVQDVLGGAVGGMQVTETVEGLERYGVIVRYPRELRDNLPRLKRVLVATPGGAQIPLGQLASFSFEMGPAMIKSENARRTAWVFVDIKNTDVGTYVKEAQALLAKEMDLPPGMSLVWSGQFEYMQRAAARLKVVIPLTLLVIFLLLYLHFRGLANTLTVMLSLPVALVGGVWLMYLLGFNFSVAVIVGFIALAGLAAETGVVMLVYLEEAHHRRQAEGHLHTREDLDAAVMEGAADRLRPKLMTVGTTLIGLFPVMFSHGTGSEVMQRIAAPMVGGLISSTVLTLVVIPVIYSLVHGRALAPLPAVGKDKATSPFPLNPDGLTVSSS